MPGGTCARVTDLPPAARALLDEARRGVLGTLDASGTPHLVPVCFALAGAEIVTAIDHKPKRGRPARLDNVARDARASLLVDRWDEDWTRLAWVMVRGRARLEPPGTGGEALAARYPPYRDRPPAGPVIVIEPERVSWWSWA